MFFRQELNQITMMSEQERTVLDRCSIVRESHGRTSGSDTSDSVILGVRRHDPVRWQEFCVIYTPILTAYLRKHRLGEDEADEVLQEILVRLLVKIDTYDRTRCRFRDWLFRVAHNAMVDSIRRRACYERALEGWARSKLSELESDRKRMEAYVVRLHHEKILEHALRVVESRVSPLVWACFVGRLIEDRPGIEIARKLGLTGSNAVFVNASKALKLVRAVCQEFDEDISDDLDSSLS
jgi:RNA polymerase sigma factor (sigma-70 family)